MSNRMNDCGAKLVLTTTAVGPNGASLKSMVSRAIAELVPVSIVMDVVQHQLVAAAEATLGEQPTPVAKPLETEGSRDA